MTRVGIFLGSEPWWGGLFVYTQSLMDALRATQDGTLDVRVAYVNSAWAPILAAYPFESRRVRRGNAGLHLASLAMHARLPGAAARAVGWYLNPIPRQLAELDCGLWIFPAQDTLSYQVRLPVVSTVHDLMHRYESSFPEVSSHGRGALRDHRFRNMVSWARAVLVDSEVGKQQVIESYGVDPDKVFPLPYVPPSYIYAEEAPDFDRRYSLPKKFILYPARFLSHKNHGRLIAAAASIRSRVTDIALVFTGSRSEDYEAVRNCAGDLGILDRITFAGYVPPHDLGGFYRRARAMVMPTFFGPTNIPPLEAFVCGCPVAVSNIYGMPDQVGDAALLFDPLSVDQIACAVETLWKDDELCGRLIAAGRQRVERWGTQQFGEELRRILNL
jgi:glycosyltransferase involved in cell wall biosynthesis